MAQWDDLPRELVTLIFEFHRQQHIAHVRAPAWQTGFLLHGVDLISDLSENITSALNAGPFLISDPTNDPLPGLIASWKNVSREHVAGKPVVA